jgi:putative oligomerization/nucleic acid binding protein
MGLLRMAARTAVVAGTATAVSGRIARRQARRYDQQAEPEPAPQAQYAPAEDAPPEDDLSTKVQQLAALHSQGLLTDDEFAAAKAKALGI